MLVFLLLSNPVLQELNYRQVSINCNTNKEIMNELGLTCSSSHWALIPGLSDKYG